MKEYENNNWENEGGAYVHEPTNGDEANPDAIHGQAAHGPVVSNGWDETGPVQTILLMRIYDILLAILREQNQTLASNIEEAHKAGYIFGPVPSFTPGDPNE